MPNIKITVRDKIARTQEAPEIVCGNSDYAVMFDLDAEWESYDLKTMHVVWTDIPAGEQRFADVQFAGSTAMLPAIYNAHRVEIGVYAGNIRTTTSAVVPCSRCITDGEPMHPDPPPDIYEQLIEMISSMMQGGATAGVATILANGAEIIAVGNAEEVLEG